MKHHLNTLFITTNGAYLARERQSVLVRVCENEQRVTRLRVPIHTIGSIVCLARVGASASLMSLCADNAVSLNFCTPHGRLMGRVVGFSSGNVLLRRAQYAAADDLAQSTKIAAPLVAAKIANGRAVLLRAIRDGLAEASQPPVRNAIARLALSAQEAAACDNLDRLRGIEGAAAADYFAVFDHLILANRGRFRFEGRVRRPPTDPVNALLSFVYALLAADARTAAECVGLDAAVGFLHRDRPGRPGLALDLMEELRPILADRLVLSLINRQQIMPDDFETGGTMAVKLKDAARKRVIVAWQKRKQATITHAFIGDKVTAGLIVHLQARLLARHLRGDIDGYPAFIWR
jgi:CRISPR-associated protein Cas1